MRVFVTGGTGFVGSHVVERLIEAGHEPVCLVRETSDTAHLDRLGVDTVVGSLSEVEALRATLEACDAVIHIAGIIKARDVETFYRVNGEATGELARVALEANPELVRFVYMSSMSAQGPSAGPQPRPPERDPAPVSHYGRSKLDGERRVRDIEGLPVSIFRPPPVYGPRDYEMLAVFKMAKTRIAPLYGDGEATMSLVYVEDLARAIVAAVETDHPSGAVFPIDDGRVHTWRSLVADFGRAIDARPVTLCVPHVVFAAAARASEAWGKVTNQAVIFTRDKLAEMSQDHWVCGHEALREELGWSPQWTVEEGAAKTAQWYLEQGWL